MHVNLISSLRHENLLYYAAPSVAHLKIRLRAFTNTRLIELANILQSPNCNISRLELCGSFGDEGVEFLADALKTNRTVKTISIGHSENFSDRGGRGIIRACKDRDGSGSWTSKFFVPAFETPCIPQLADHIILYTQVSYVVIIHSGVSSYHQSMHQE